MANEKLEEGDIFQATYDFLMWVNISKNPSEDCEEFKTSLRIFVYDPKSRGKRGVALETVHLILCLYSITCTFLCLSYLQCLILLVSSLYVQILQFWSYSCFVLRFEILIFYAHYGIMNFLCIGICLNSWTKEAQRRERG